MTWAARCRASGAYLGLSQGLQQPLGRPPLLLLLSHEAFQLLVPGLVGHHLQRSQSVISGVVRKQKRASRSLHVVCTRRQQRCMPTIPQGSAGRLSDCHVKLGGGSCDALASLAHLPNVQQQGGVQAPTRAVGFPALAGDELLPLPCPAGQQAVADGSCTARRGQQQLRPWCRCAARFAPPAAEATPGVQSCV